MTTSPRTHALRYRIWAYCQPLGWDVTIPQIADALDVSVGTVSNVMKSAGWLTRARSSRFDSGHTSIPMYRASQRTTADVVAGRIGALVDA